MAVSYTRSLIIKFVYILVFGCRFILKCNKVREQLLNTKEASGTSVQTRAQTWLVNRLD